MISHRQERSRTTSSMGTYLKAGSFPSFSGFMLLGCKMLPVIFPARRGREMNE